MAKKSLYDNTSLYDEYQYMLKQLADSVTDRPSTMISAISNKKQVFSILTQVLSLNSPSKLTMQEWQDIIPYNAEDITIRKYICKRGSLFKSKIYNVMSVSFPSVVPDSVKDSSGFKDYLEVGSIVVFYDDSCKDCHVGITQFGFRLPYGNVFTTHMFENHYPFDVLSWLQQNNATGFGNLPDDSIYELYTLACRITGTFNPREFAFTPA
ncbi:MAG: hypothetical protein IJH43_05350 [Mogibacterium sp.]|nr:hypothetical protein [Mogibacterium sp.]